MRLRLIGSIDGMEDNGLDLCRDVQSEGGSDGRRPDLSRLICRRERDKLMRLSELLGKND